MEKKSIQLVWRGKVYQEILITPVPLFLDYG